MSDTTTWVRAYSCALWELADVFLVRTKCFMNVLVWTKCFVNVLDRTKWPAGNLRAPMRKFPKIQPVNPKGNQPWVFTGRNEAEAETPTLWPPAGKNWLNGKDPDVGEDWRQEKGVTEDDVVCPSWTHGHEFEQTPGDSGGQVCCSPWGHIE